MHRSGTSLLAAILSDLGVHMGDDLFMRGRGNNAHFEDKDFIRLNRKLLAFAGGRWNAPPDGTRLWNAGIVLSGYTSELIQHKNKRILWGWKDPRTCLTIHIIHPHLLSPRYIWIRRNADDIVDSLIARGGPQAREPLVDLCAVYESSVGEFLRDKSPLIVSYEDLVNRAQADGVVMLINRFVDGNGKIRQAVERIRFRD